jgi:hypothetical protein
MLRFDKDNSGTERDAVSREIAERCANAILAQLSHEAQMMNAAQLRGYVRARAWSQVWAKVKDAAAAGRVRRSDVNDLAARVLEQTVHITVAANSAAPVVAMPTPHIARRAA